MTLSTSEAELGELPLSRSRIVPGRTQDMTSESFSHERKKRSSLSSRQEVGRFRGYKHRGYIAPGKWWQSPKAEEMCTQLSIWNQANYTKVDMLWLGNKRPYVHASRSRGLLCFP